MTAIAQSVERFAAGELALIAGEDGTGAVVALAAAQASGPAIGQLYELGGDMVVLGLQAEIAAQLQLSGPPRVTPDPSRVTRDPSRVTRDPSRVTRDPSRATRKRGGLMLGTPIDATDCVAGGWSLEDRAHTVRVVASAGTRPEDLTVPGHVHPAAILDTDRSGPGLALELARAAGQPGAVAISAVLDRTGAPVTLGVARRDARLRALTAAPAQELCSLALARQLGAGAVRCDLPTRLGGFEAVGYAGVTGGDAVIALVHGQPARRPRPLVHTHIACLLGDTFSSLACECHGELDRAAQAIVGEGAGVIVYVKPALEDPFTCPRGRAIEPALVSAVLRQAGVGTAQPV